MKPSSMGGPWLRSRPRSGIRNASAMIPNTIALRCRDVSRGRRRGRAAGAGVAVVARSPASWELMSGSCAVHGCGGADDGLLVDLGLGLGERRPRPPLLERAQSCVDRD